MFALFLLLSIKSLAVVNYDTEKNLSFFFYPFLFMCVAGMTGWPRLFARTVAAGTAFALIGMFYVGMLPVKFMLGSGVDEKPYLKKVYEPSKETNDIAPMFFREMKADPDGRYIYISYGPTSGIAKIDTRRGRVDTLIHVPGMMRFLWDDGDPRGELLGLDWLHADMHFFKKTPFEKVRTVDLLKTDPTPSPFDFEVDTRRGRIYIVNYELSGITTYSYPGMEKIARSDFIEQGVTRLKSGGQRIVYDPSADKIYALVGWVHWMQDYYILRIDPGTLKVEKSIRLPTAGLELSFCAAAHSLFSVDFYGRTLYEIEVPSMKLKRTVLGPVGSRNVVCDMTRGNIYATGYADGMMSVIDYRSGRTKTSFGVGPKPSSMALLEDRGELFIGSGAGILKVDLGRLPDRKK